MLLQCVYLGLLLLSGWALCCFGSAVVDQQRAERSRYARPQSKAWQAGWLDFIRICLVSFVGASVIICGVRAALEWAPAAVERSPATTSVRSRTSWPHPQVSQSVREHLETLGMELYEAGYDAGYEAAYEEDEPVSEAPSTTEI
jgi:hypothetical protein